MMKIYKFQGKKYSTKEKAIKAMHELYKVLKGNLTLAENNNMIQIQYDYDVLENVHLNFKAFGDPVLVLEYRVYEKYGTRGHSWIPREKKKILSIESEEIL